MVALGALSKAPNDLVRGVLDRKIIGMVPNLLRFGTIIAQNQQTVRKLPEFGVKQREERAVRESERLGLIGRLTRPKAPRTPVRADRAA